MHSFINHQPKLTLSFMGFLQNKNGAVKPKILAFFIIFGFFIPNKIISQPVQVLFSQCPKDTTLVACELDNTFTTPDFLTTFPVTAYLDGENPSPFKIRPKLPDCPPENPNCFNVFNAGTTTDFILLYEAINEDSVVVAQNTCSFKVTVIPDTIPPIFRYCPSNLVLIGQWNNGVCTANGLWPTSIAYDNCDRPITVTSQVNQQNGPCGSVLNGGENIITYQATDFVGNTSTCSFVVTVNCPTKVFETTNSPFSLNIIPNPNNGQFVVEMTEPTPNGLIFRINDLAGRLLIEKTTETGSKIQTIAAQQLPEGLYFLQIVSEGKVLAVKKFVKQ
jgi:hypothetical protein